MYVSIMLVFYLCLYILLDIQKDQNYIHDSIRSCERFGFFIILYKSWALWKLPKYLSKYLFLYNIILNGKEITKSSLMCYYSSNNYSNNNNNKKKILCQFVTEKLYEVFICTFAKTTFLYRGQSESFIFKMQLLYEIWR